jgi:hypothetical protein
MRATKSTGIGGSMIKRLALGFALLLAVACGGGGALDSVENRVLVQLEHNGAATTSLKPNTVYHVVLRVTSLDAALHLNITFVYDSAHFEVIAPQEVFLTAGLEQDIQFDLVTKSLSNVNGEIAMEIDAPADLTVEPLVYTITP